MKEERTYDRGYHMRGYYIDADGICCEKRYHRLLRCGHIAIGVLWMLLILGILHIKDLMEV